MSELTGKPVLDARCKDGKTVRCGVRDCHGVLAEVEGEYFRLPVGVDLRKAGYYAKTKRPIHRTLEGKEVIKSLNSENGVVDGALDAKWCGLDRIERDGHRLPANAGPYVVCCTTCGRLSKIKRSCTEQS